MTYELNRLARSVSHLKYSLAEHYLSEAIKQKPKKWVLDSLHNAIKCFNSREVIETVSLPTKKIVFFNIGYSYILYHVKAQAVFVTVEKTFKSSKQTMQIILSEGS